MDKNDPFGATVESLTRVEDKSCDGRKPGVILSEGVMLPAESNVLSVRRELASVLEYAAERFPDDPAIVLERVVHLINLGDYPLTARKVKATL